MRGHNEALAQIGPEYKAENVGGTGRSYGEDKFMVPPDVKADPKKMAGLLVAGVVMDGDWNIALYHARANGICNNPDPKTYNPDCLNWVPTMMFTEAGEKYIQGACEDRMVVKNDPKTGETKRTGETKNVCVNAVVTWTPGDVTIAQKKGGLVNALTTRENDSQMAVAIIGLKGWNARNRATVEGILAAGLEAGDQIKRGGGPVLMRASAASAKIFGEGDAKYWTKYYGGALLRSRSWCLQCLRGCLHALRQDHVGAVSRRFAELPPGQRSAEHQLSPRCLGQGWYGEGHRDGSRLRRRHGYR
jgi:hypothetical protein